MPHAEDPAGVESKHRLILCFDGTGNAYQADTSDTNIVKLLEMLDRSSPEQMHYYQPGIGTYTNESSVNQGFFGRVKSSISKTIDTGLGTTFDAHVMAGYRFLMRYYEDNDRIYIFGFSRGAFTARFLSRMVAHVGLLSRGNEEMVPFAFKLYQDYEMNHDAWENYMVRFRGAFCRGDEQSKVKPTKDVLLNPDPTGGVKVHFLGLFDTVGSVGTLDRGLIKPPPIHGTAHNVRHAVAIDEHRVKFKAALLSQDRQEAKDENIKEVWFPGNHGDVGGGWTAQTEAGYTAPTLYERLGNVPWFWKSWFAKKADPTEAKSNTVKDRFQLSDIALKWMIEELDEVESKNNQAPVAWNWKKQDFLDRYENPPGAANGAIVPSGSRSPAVGDVPDAQAINGFMHDTMTVGGGSGFGKTLLWNIMEYLPGIWRWEYSPERKKSNGWKWWSKSGETEAAGWQKTYFPLNKGGCRDLVVGALVHQSLLDRMAAFKDYQPKNDVFISGSSRTYRLSEAQELIVSENGRAAEDHTVYLRKQPRLKTGSTDKDMIYRVEDAQFHKMASASGVSTRSSRSFA